MEKITESASHYRHLEQMSVAELLENINKEDLTVPLAVQKALPQIEALVSAIVPKMREGGRLFYIGAGTSGRLGVLDASEIPPTFGAPPDWVIGLIAGGDRAIRNPVEHAEDNTEQAWVDLQAWQPDALDTVIGIASSGTTPYVVSGLRACRQHGISTGCITCNPGAPILAEADYPVLAVVGPEFVTGSSRMKAGTAQKLILNMISTSVMIQLGRVQDNRMVDMKLSNAKLVDRGTRMIVQSTNMDYEAAKALLLKCGSVRAALLEARSER
ncbi:MAG: N-acetylmuramic acid 6-phosphate etherase [Saprospiraceae bacterium]|nr:N-acetylmuramic acid 6-phosphate etherase [Saprospiraceae bacterium]